MARHENLIAETIYDLSYLAGTDELNRFIEDSRELFILITDWAEEFDKKYPMPENDDRDFYYIFGIDYLTAIDYFYIEKRNELIKNEYNVDNEVVLNTLFKIKC
jgi:hypothetical protein